MKQYLPRIFAIVFALIITLSLMSTVYSTFIINDFTVSGVYIEIEDDIAFIEFYYDGEDYETESDILDTEHVLMAIAGALEQGSEGLTEVYYTAAENALYEAFEALETFE